MAIEIWQDLRLAIRGVVNRPALTLLIVLTLALGLGPNTVIFSLVNAVLLRPLPVEDPSSLVRFSTTAPDGSFSSRFSYPDYRDFESLSGVFTGIAAQSLNPMTLEAGGVARPMLGEVVSGDYFSVLGVSAQLGRLFLPGDDASARTIVLGHSLFERAFGSDPSIVGSTVRVNGEPFTIAGVAEKRFTGTTLGLFPDLWVPLAQTGSWRRPGWETARDREWLHLIGRLAPGVPGEQAQAVVSARAAQIDLDHPEIDRDRRVALGPATLLHGERRTGAAAFLAVVSGLALLVLIVACANVATLLLVEGHRRRREVVIRRALGASRWRVARPFLIESTLRAVLGGAGGVLIAVWAGGALQTLNPIPTVPLRFDLSPDANVLLFSALLALLSGVALGVAPALRSAWADVAPALKEESTGIAGGRSRNRTLDLLVVAQVGVSAVLLICGGLFLRSLSNAKGMDPGFDVAETLAMDFDMERGGRTPREGRAAYERLLDHVRSMSEVAGAALADLAPMDLATENRILLVDGYEPPSGAPAVSVSVNVVSPAYFDTLGIAIRQGRDLTASDANEAPRVAVINETMARRYWPDGGALGKRFTLSSRQAGRGMTGDAVDLAVVGIARDVRYRTLGEEPEPHVYLPFLQEYQPEMTLLVRTKGNASTMLETIRRRAQESGERMEPFFSRTMTQHAGFALLPARLAAILSGLFGAMALLLALVGIYGVMWEVVTQRTREIGIRMVVGASPSSIMGLVVRRGLVVGLAGSAAGLLASATLTRFLRSLLHGVSHTDVTTFVAVSVGLVVAVMLSCLIPARGAAALDPVRAIRHE